MIERNNSYQCINLSESVLDQIMQGNSIILGDAGVGKTTFVRSAVYHLVLSKKKVVMVDVIQENGQFTKALNGEVITYEQITNHPFNNLITTVSLPITHFRDSSVCNLIWNGLIDELNSGQFSIDYIVIDDVGLLLANGCNDRLINLIKAANNNNVNVIIAGQSLGNLSKEELDILLEKFLSHLVFSSFEFRPIYNLFDRLARGEAILFRKNTNDFIKIKCMYRANEMQLYAIDSINL